MIYCIHHDVIYAISSYGAEESESVAGPSIDKEGEASACELGIRYPTLQAIYAGKLNRQTKHRGNFHV